VEYKSKNRNEILEELDVDSNQGLSEDQVEEHRKKYGSNEFEEEEETSLFSKIIEQFKEIMNIILLFAGFLSLYIAFSNPEQGYSEPIVIFVIIFINIAITIYQENQAENALEALKNISTPETRVLREGEAKNIPSSEVVQGDIVMLQAGQGISADVRLLEANSLQTEETALTGESVPVDKDSNSEAAEDDQIGDIAHTAFSGTTVTNGNAKGVVVAVGMDSEMGNIAGLLGGNERQSTPLQQRISRLAKRLAGLAFVAGIVIFAINYFTTDITLLNNLMTAVSLAIAAVPETLPVIVSLTLAYGVQNMAGKHAIIRNMPAVETLGSASVVASDKTGTLTKNEMTIQRIWNASNHPKKAEEEYDEKEKWMMKMLALASNAKSYREEGELKVEGDPTEQAIIQLVETKGWSVEDLNEKFPRVKEFPFDSTKKRMTTVHQNGDKYLVLSKGAFESITNTANLPSDITTNDLEEINEQFANQALRVLAVAYKELDELPSEEMTQEEVEENMTFSGMIGMIDPPREESRQSVREAINAGIHPIMITGDHSVTATAIAKDIGIADEKTKTITGNELQELSDEELNEHIEEYAVYARVSPEDKIRILEAWQEKGEVVAMTGDGVNDAPSLESADVGTAMGENGTEVAKNASDMILTDDNFDTIIHAIEEGRRAYNNIRKTVYLLLSANIAEVLLMLAATILGWGIPLMPIHLLFINVIGDGLPGFGLSREKADADVMKQEPIDRDESIFARGGYAVTGVGAITLLIVSLSAFYLGTQFQLASGITPSLEVGQTMAFLTLSWGSAVNIFVIRSRQSVFKIGLTSNKTIFWSTLLSLFLTAIIVVVPFLAEVFAFAELSLLHWAIAALLSLVIIATIEVYKYFFIDV